MALENKLFFLIQNDIFAFKLMIIHDINKIILCNCSK